MTLIPADTKDAKSPQGPSMPTMNSFPNPILEPEISAHDLPPYTETDTSSQNRGISPRQAPVPTPDQKIPESNAINANDKVHITGPLHVLGYAWTFHCLKIIDTDGGAIDLSSRLLISNSRTALRLMARLLPLTTSNYQTES
jgi:hypothetical protein